MAIESVAYLSITMLLETRAAKLAAHAVDQARVNVFFDGKNDSFIEDEDVAAEAKFVDALHKGLTNPGDKEGQRSWSEGTVLLENLHKVYPPSLAPGMPRFCSKGCCSRHCCCSGDCCCCKAASIDEHSGEFQETAVRKTGFKHAVRGLSLAVPAGETFGFLGDD
jgi:ABC-type glutathione transport system ATPase component